MKKRLITGTVICFFIAMFIPGAVRAAGVSIGATTWLCWWEPFWLKYKSALVSGNNSAIKMTPMYGPLLTFHLPKHVNLSSLFMYGEFNGIKKEKEFGLPFYTVKENIFIKRYDSDTSMSYYIFPFFHITIGFKYLHYQYKIREILIITQSLDFVNKTYNEFAPALGIGFLVPLIKKQLYMAINSSVIFSFSTFKVSGHDYSFLTGPMYYQETTPSDNDYFKLGLNTSVVLAYWIEAVNMSFSIGFRYQMFKLLTSDQSIGIDNQTKYYDHLYGITASVIYRINFKKKENTEKINEKVK